MSQQQQQQQQQQHPHWLKATFTACLCSNPRSESDDEREVQQGAGPSSTGGRRIFARDELEGLLASASSDEEGDADAMSLHSNVGRATRNKRARRKGKGKGKRKDAWGVVGRNLSGNSRRSIQMFGWYPFGKPIALPDSSSDEEQGDERSTSRRTRTLSNASDAAPLDPSEIVARMTLEDNTAPTGTANLDLMRANFEPDATSEDLEREERELAEQEEAAAVAAFSFPAVPQVEPPREASPIVEAAPEPKPEPEPEPEPEQPQVQELEVPTEDLDPESATATPSLQTSSTPLTSSSPLTPLSPPPPSSPTKSTAPPPPPSGTSTPLTHAERIKKAAKEQRRRMKEEAARRKKEDMERRAEAAAGGFEFDSPQTQPQHEFGEFQAGVAWTESDGASSHPSQYQYQAQYQPPQNLPQVAALPLHPAEHPLSPWDDELLDYGAEYASRRPTAPTRKLTLGSGSGSERSGPIRPPHAVPLPPSSLASESPRKPNFMHRATGSGTLSSHSGWSGHQQAYPYHQPMQVPIQPLVPLEVEFDGIPGGLEHDYPHPHLAQAHSQEFEGVPGGALASRHTRSRAGSVMDSGVAKRTFVPQRSHTSSIDSFAAAGGGGFPSTGFGRGGARGLDGAAAAMMLGGDYTQE
ncbi:hypothetical protein FRB90_009243 [Tulasnella sp. 427]|nr:hypothetical protein FRB90_009243 [Tulasnella sp. 427]